MTKEKPDFELQAYGIVEWIGVYRYQTQHESDRHGMAKKIGEVLEQAYAAGQASYPTAAELQAGFDLKYAEGYAAGVADTSKAIEEKIISRSEMKRINVLKGKPILCDAHEALQKALDGK